MKEPRSSYNISDLIIMQSGSVFVVCCSALLAHLCNGVLTFNPEQDGIQSLSDKMAVVMRNGLPDMRTVQDELELVMEEEEKEATEIDTTPDMTSSSDLTSLPNQKIQSNGEKEVGTWRSRRKRFVLKSKRRQWTHGIIPYVFGSDISTKDQTNIKQKVFGMFEYWTHFRFVPWNATVPDMYNLDHRNYLIFIRKHGCWSRLGNYKSWRGQQISCCTNVECMHELGHALGFYHEHTSPIRDDVIRINYENIQNGRSINFRKEFPGEKQMFGYYDTSSVMSYYTTAFSKNMQETITVLDPEMEFLTYLRDDLDFYFFYEAQTVYNMKGEKCPDFPVTCQNDGYVSYINGSCRCRCPDGLDHSTGCATQIGADIWPEGIYSLLRGPNGQCPSGFEEGVIKFFSEAEHTSDKSGNPSHTLDFCTKTYHQFRETAHPWFSGRYCVFSINSTCPAGFNLSSALYGVSGSFRNASRKGITPDFELTDELKIGICCHRNNADIDDVILVPSQKPTVLLQPIENETMTCTDSKGMEVITISNRWKQQNSPGMMDMCLYLPKPDSATEGCGDFIHLSELQPEVQLSTPTFPSLYTTNIPCTWFIKGPENSKLVLDFIVFDVPQEKINGPCQSYVEIRYMLPGQPGIKYCGRGFKKTIVSHRETLSLRLGVMDKTSSIQVLFQATVRLIQDRDMCYTNEGKDNSYQGTVNFGYNYEKCLPWDRVTHCRHHAFNATKVDLERNYCRNPGHGTEPWCYTNAETCARIYCDVCNIRRCYNIFEQCETFLRNDPDYCHTDPEAERGCRQTCGLCSLSQRAEPGSRISCGPPNPNVTNAQLISKTRSTYYVGDTVSYVCNSARDGQVGNDVSSSTKKVRSLCTSEGVWTSVQDACSSSCVNQRTDCGELLQRNPTMCQEYPEFSKLKCAYTCSLCESINAIRRRGICPGHVTISNVTEISAAPYLEGDIIRYTCVPGNVNVYGDLHRACLSDSTVTGIPPRCVAINDVSTDLFNVEIRRRRHVTSRNRIYTISSRKMAIAREGEIGSWRYYSVFGGTVTFQVWRQSGNTSQFILIGNNTIKEAYDDRVITVHIPQSQRIAVEPGDFIGVQLPSSGHAGISMDRCYKTYNPEGAQVWVANTKLLYEVGNIYSMRAGTGCQILSINAVISPSPKPQPSLIKAFGSFYNSMLWSKGG